MINDSDFKRIRQAVTGDLSPEEQASYQTWISTDPEWAIAHAELTEVWRLAEKIGPNVDTDAALARAKMLMSRSATALSRTTPEDSATKGGLGKQRLWIAGKKQDRFSGRTLRRWGWPVVAGTLCVAVIAASWKGIGYFGQRTTTTMLTYTTGNAERANVTLPDGNTVLLNVASRLDVPADYVTGHHTVRLVGEALFTVAHGTKTPFSVIAGSISARVLGTSFVVRNYPTDTAVTVAVRDGKVAVRSTVLTAAQQVVAGRTGATRVGQADPAQFSFATGVLAFNGVPLRDAVVALNRWYDADIRLGDATLGARQITGGFTAGAITDLVENLALTFNVRIVRDGRVITVYPR